MEQFVYTGVILFIGLPFLLKMNDPNLPLHKNKIQALKAMALPALVFIVWDILVTDLHWSFNDRFILGVKIMNLPLEEVLFFVFVPLTSILLYETVGYFLGRRR